MRVPLGWLREYVRVDATAHEMARRLSISTLEVERVIEVGVPRVDGNLEHLVVGRVVSAEKHPNADRLQLCQVDVGNPEPQQIVCGAWNFGAGATVAVALPGATVLSKDGEAFTLGEAKLRGEVSRGMILAEDEVGLGSDHDGDHAAAGLTRAWVAVARGASDLGAGARCHPHGEPRRPALDGRLCA